MERGKLKPYSLSKAYGLLEPGPVVLVTTAAGKKRDVMALSWHTLLDFEPPVIGFALSEGNYSYSLLEASRECVIAIPTAAMVSTVVRVGNCSGRTVDKFGKFGLETAPAAVVKAPLLTDCFANLECRVIDRSWARKYNFFVLETVRAWMDPAARNPKTLHHRGWGSFMVAGRTIKVPSNKR